MSHRNQNVLKARRDFLTNKRGQNKESTVRYYESITNDFTEFLTNRDIEVTQEIDGYLIKQWKQKRQKKDDVSPITLHNNTKHLRVFIRWLESSELVKGGLADKMQIPDVNTEQRRSDEVVSPEHIENIINHLEIYEYATRLHAITKFLWHTGSRISAAIALDLDDFQPRDGIVKVRNRKDTGTGLKNGQKSERNIGISESVIEVLNDYIQGRRKDATDDYGREPLFTTVNGRMARQRVYKNFVAISRPCVYNDSCPHNRELDECEAAQKKKKAYDCPSSKALHPIRRGSITYHLNQDWPLEKVSERCDVGKETLKKHYDSRTHRDKQQGRSQYVDKL